MLMVAFLSAFSFYYALRASFWTPPQERLGQIDIRSVLGMELGSRPATPRSRLYSRRGWPRVFAKRASFLISTKNHILDTFDTFAWAHCGREKVRWKKNRSRRCLLLPLMHPESPPFRASPGVRRVDYGDHILRHLGPVWAVEERR
jgi:hypothetical protein